MNCIVYHFNSKRKGRSSDALLPGTGIETYTETTLGYQVKLPILGRRLQLTVQDTTVRVNSSNNSKSKIWLILVSVFIYQYLYYQCLLSYL